MHESTKAEYRHRLRIILQHSEVGLKQLVLDLAISPDVHISTLYTSAIESIIRVRVIVWQIQVYAQNIKIYTEISSSLNHQ